jgi:hypothetical protein
MHVRRIPARANPERDRPASLTFLEFHSRLTSAIDGRSLARSSWLSIQAGAAARSAIQCAETLEYASARTRRSSGLFY